MKALTAILSLCAALALAACGDDGSGPEDTGSGAEAAATASGAEASERGKPAVEVPAAPPPEELLAEDAIEGTGAAAAAGEEVTVHYVGVDYETGEQFDASWDRGEPFAFRLGAGEVIAGWDLGVEGMKVGGRRTLIVPPDLAYGPTGSPPAIGPEATLVFVVDLLEVE